MERKRGEKDHRGRGGRDRERQTDREKELLAELKEIQRGKIRAERTQSQEKFDPGKRNRNESRAESVERRLRNVKSNPEYMQLMFQVVKELEKDAKYIKAALDFLPKEPAPWKSCKFYNNFDRCKEKEFCHVERNTTTVRLHVCTVCSLLLNLAHSHPVTSCPIIKKLDTMDDEGEKEYDPQAREKSPRPSTSGASKTAGNLKTTKKAKIEKDILEQVDDLLYDKEENQDDLSEEADD